MLNKFLFRQVDNAPLIIFRVFFGFLIACECFGAIFTGWIRYTLIEPEFTFNFIGFGFLQPLPGNGMYLYFAVMGFLGLLIMAGCKYRLSLGAFTLLWTAVYLMQKASYNNHYYLLILLCLFMLVLPANAWLSVDAKSKPELRKISMSDGCRWLIIIQVWIVYTYASVAKWYPDWLNLSVAQTLMKPKENYYLIGGLLQEPWLHAFISYAGILFDLLIVPLLLYKPTRKYAFFASVFFHLFNAVVFQIGIFPFLSLAFTVFFYEPETIRNLFLKKKPLYTSEEIIVPKYKNAMLITATAYFLIQLALPLRHWFFKDDVLWTEEGHRLSWRMMLRTKSGYIRFKVEDKKTGEATWVYPKDRLSRKQQGMVATKPDVIWQFAQRLKKEYAAKGKDVAVYAIGQVSVNNGPMYPFIDPKTDLASERWYHFKHHDWILPSPK